MPAYLSPGVYIREVGGPKPIEAVGTSVAAFIGFTEKRPEQQRPGEARLVTSWTQYLNDFGGFVNEFYLPLSVYGFFLNGGGICYIVSLMTRDDVPALVASSPSSKPARQVPARGEGVAGSLVIQSQATGAVTVVVEDAGSNAEDQFKLVVRGPAEAEETFDNLSFAKTRGGRNAVEVVNRESKLIKLQEVESPAALAERRPKLGNYQLAAPKAEAAPVVSSETFNGNPTDRVGLVGLESIEDINMVCVPDLMSAYQRNAITKAEVKAVQDQVIAHCASMKDRVAILDPLPGMNPQQVKDWRLKEANFDTPYAALYYPWIEVANPAATNGKKTLAIPPSGHVAGVYARVDGERGVFKAPANELLRGVVEMSFTVNTRDQDTLNPDGINCIRTFPGRGVRIWGARTLAKTEAEWRYVNVRRLFCMIEESIYQATQWAVFEPNDYTLWARLRRDIGAFLKRQWLDGALFGATPEEAFYVKCDAELNTPERIEAGELHVEVGIAPVKPAEFIVISFKQLSGVEQ